MHDDSIDRTTTGSGNVSTLTYDEINQYYLLSQNGGGNAQITQNKVPTLEEVIKLCNGKILLNLDKLNFSQFEEIYEIFEKNGAASIAMFKSSSYTPSQLTKWFCKLIEDGKELPLFSPMIYSANYAGEPAKTVISQFKGLVSMMECDRESDTKVAEGTIAHISSCGIRAMCLTALTNNPPLDNPTYWADYKNKGFAAIMTDNPVELEKFINNN